MPTVRFDIVYGVNEGLVFSPSELLQLHFFGISTCTKDGQKLSDEVIKQKILEAQQFIENYLDLFLLPRIYDESKDFQRSFIQQWGYLQATYNINCALLAEGYLNDSLQVTYPRDWLSIQKNNEPKDVTRNMHIIPISKQGAVGSQQGAVFTGIAPYLGFYGMNQIPNYWHVTYSTGFDRVPDDIKAAIGKLAAIPIFAILGDVLYGPGISSFSLGFDGLSQSTSTTRSSDASIYNSRIKMYSEDLKTGLDLLRRWYKGISMEVL